MRSFRTWRDGFTLIEMLVVIAIMVFCAFTLPSFASEPAHEHPFLLMTRADIASLKEAVAKNAETAELAKAFLATASKKRVEQLPPFVPDWWKQKIGKEESYTVINRNTMHIPRVWADLSLEYARAGLLDPAFAAKAHDLLLCLVTEYQFPPEEYNDALNNSRVGFSALAAYDILYDTFAESERARLNEYFDHILHSAQQFNQKLISRNWPLCNYDAWMSTTLCMQGLFYNKPELVEYALHGPRGVDDALMYGFKDDGLWCEESLAYAYTEIGGLLQIAEMLRNIGYPFDLYRSAIDGRTIKQGYDVNFELMQPDGTIPEIGDAYGGRVYPAEYRTEYGTLYKRFGGSKYAWLLHLDPNFKRSPAELFTSPSAPPEGAAPAQYSRLWPDKGFAALRSVEGPDYWSGKGWTLFATYTAAIGHQHFDKLSITLFGDGHLWLPDSEAHSKDFWGSVYALNMHTLAHNTVMVNSDNQRYPRRNLDLIEYDALADAKHLTMGDLNGQLYEGVRQMRTCVVCDRYVVEFFQVQSAQPKEFAWVTHVDGKPEGCSETEWEAASLPQGDTWGMISNGRKAKAAAASIWETFSHDQAPFRMDILTDAPAEYEKCDFPMYREELAKEPRPMRMVVRKADKAWFAAVYRCGESAALPLKIEVAPSGYENNWKLTVKLGDHTYEHRIPMLPSGTP